jgi:hypothetical protein
VILACLRFTAIKIGIALMAITAKSSNVLIGGRPMAENSPSITPTIPFRESFRQSGQNPIFTLFFSPGRSWIQNCR